MIYSHKHQHHQDQSSDMQKFLMILGLVLVSGLIGGISALIYGFVKPSQSGKLGGLIVSGASAGLILFVVIIYFLCRKKIPVHTNRTHHTKGHANHHHQPREYEKNSSDEVTRISTISHPQVHQNVVEHERSIGQGVGDRSHHNSTSPLKATHTTYLN